LVLLEGREEASHHAEGSSSSVNAHENSDNSPDQHCS